MNARSPRRYSLRQRIRYQLTRLIRLYVALTGAVFIVTSLMISYYYKLASLEHLHDLVEARVSVEGGNMLQQVQALGASSVLWTGMTDAVGRSIYLEPLLKQFNDLGSHQLFLLDYRGRVLLTPDKEQATRLLESAPVVKAVRDARSAYGMARSGVRGEELFIYARPIFSPQVESPVGFIVGSMSPQDVLKDLALDNGVKVTLNVGGAPKVSSVFDFVLLERGESTVIHRGDEHVPLQVHLAQKQWDTLFFVCLLLTLVALFGRWIILRVNAWSQKFAANTTERLDLLVHTCQEILLGRTVTPQLKDYDDEISSVFQALAKMLSQQKKSPTNCAPPPWCS